MPTNDEIIKKWLKEKAYPGLQEFFADHSKTENDKAQKGLEETEHDIRQMLNEARADEREKERNRILGSGEYVSKSFMELQIREERAKIIKELEEMRKHIDDYVHDYDKYPEAVAKDNILKQAIAKLKEGK